MECPIGLKKTVGGALKMLLLLLLFCRAISSMMFTLVWPIVPLILQLIVFAYWVASTVLLSTTGHAEFYRNNTNDSNLATELVSRIPCDPSVSWDNRTSGLRCYMQPPPTPFCAAHRGCYTVQLITSSPHLAQNVRLIPSSSCSMVYSAELEAGTVHSGMPIAHFFPPVSGCMRFRIINVKIWGWRTFCINWR